MPSPFETLRERGFIAQATHIDEIRELLDGQPGVTFYVGFDPTADSLQVGHCIPIMAMAHLQRAGHRPIALVGGGTTMVGDPTGRTELRDMLSLSQIEANAQAIKGQLSRFLDFSEGRALMLNNAEWLLGLNYVDFLRDIGSHFSVNRMLTAECYKSRLERGLSFIEFNYMIMQSYDFLVLAQRHGCVLQIGGDDQWSNIISGVDLIRRKIGKAAYGLTNPLIMTSDGKKMGKTAKGALWIDPKRTPPFEFYQYWRNVQDGDVGKFMRMLTFLPSSDIEEAERAEGAGLNQAKKLLALEATKLAHGQEQAEECERLASALFEGGGGLENLANTMLPAAEAEAGVLVVDLLARCGLAPSKSEARRLVSQGGVAVNGTRAAGLEAKVTSADFVGGALVLQKGKKTFHKVTLAP